MPGARWPCATLTTVGERFGALLHVSAAEAGIVAEVRAPDVTFDSRHVDANGIEVVPTPGHTPGSTCYVITGHGGLRYLFTGDEGAHLLADGSWEACVEEARAGLARHLASRSTGRR